MVAGIATASDDDHGVTLNKGWSCGESREGMMCVCGLRVSLSWNQLLLPKKILAHLNYSKIIVFSN